jgi:hypothetical protein
MKYTNDIIGSYFYIGEQKILILPNGEDERDYYVSFSLVDSIEPTRRFAFAREHFELLRISKYPEKLSNRLESLKAGDDIFTVTFGECKVKRIQESPERDIKKYIVTESGVYYDMDGYSTFWDKHPSCFFSKKDMLDYWKNRKELSDNEKDE